jgi:hypothetical protein
MPFGKGKIAHNFRFWLLGNPNTCVFRRPLCQQRSGRLFLLGCLIACAETLPDHQRGIPIKKSLGRRKPLRMLRWILHALLNRGVSSYPNCDHTGQPRSRRPGEVQPASVPSVFRQVISPGAVLKSTRVGTCPRWTNASPTTLRACSSARGPGLLHRGVPPQASPVQDVPGQGGSRFMRPAPPPVHVTKWRTSLSRTCVLFYLKPGCLSSVLVRRRRLGHAYYSLLSVWRGILLFFAASRMTISSIAVRLMPSA